ncbi:MAG: hypothetical protein HQM01_11945 [Magnetococcales bacterium]|nr:hypothetical protein [Magnetococcales bacterium]
MRTSTQRLVLAKNEATYGLDSSPTAADAILVRGLSLSPLEGGTIERGVILPHLGGQPKTHVNVSRKLDFEIEAVGSGVAGTPPVWGSLLKACAASETIDAGVSATYAPVSDNYGSLSIYHFLKGELAKLLGARGTCTLAVAAQTVPVFKFSFIGLWSPITAASQPSPNFANQPIPRPSSLANTPAFTLHGHALVMKSIDISLGVQAVFRGLVGYEGVDILDRAVTATLTCEWPSLATMDPQALARDGTTGALHMVHGTTAGNILQLDAPRVQIVDPKMIEDNRVMMLQCSLLLLPVAGNDEITITSR